MSGSLTDAQVADFRREGWLAPFRAIDEAAAAEAVRWLEAYEVHHKANVNQHLKIKGHLVSPWLVDLARNERILDAVESLIGPDLLLFAASVFAKPGGDGSYVSWHQDSAYFGLEPHEEVTAWVALTESTAANGALQVLPGTHNGPDLHHDETFEPNNLLLRGQRIRVEDESKAVTIELRPGQFSLHHERMAHGSKANATDKRRIGFAFFYIPTHVRSPAGRRSALLVRGEDRHGHWDADPLPRYDFDPPAFEALQRARGAYQDGGVRQAADIAAP
jgi:chlorinating enzyme